MKRNSVKVCVRARPTQNFAQDKIHIDEEHSTIQITTSIDEPSGVLNNRQSSFKFCFDHVFHNATQAAVYDLYARDTVQGVLDGINGAIMSYGQTGSGKTFTMMGDTANYEHRGIAPRAIAQLFNEINSRVEFEYRVSCTYMEIYNERIFDLLGDLSNPDQAPDYTIAEEKECRGTFVRGLTEVVVGSEKDALNLLFGGELSRTTATHRLNRRSNRSHSLFTMYVQQRQRSGVSEKIVHSKLHLIDLAGSERLKKTMESADGRTVTDEVTRKESMYINQSLTFLEQCVVALSRKGQTHIPYRQSKLTNILKDCLGANCNTLMIACMWGEAAHLEETVSTLRLASRMMRVQNETSTVETIDADALIKKQERLIKALKQDLLMHDALVERTGVTYDPYTPEQQASVVQMIERYIDASETEEENCLVIHSFRHMIEICRQFKLMIKRARQEISVVKEEALAGMMSQQYVATMEGRAGTTTDLHSNIQYSSDSKLIEDFHSQTAMVGELDYSKSKGFPLGVANPESRPQHGINMQYMSSKTASMPTNTSSYSTKDGKERYYSPSLPQKSSDNKGKTSLVMDLNQTKLPSSNLTNLQTDTQTQGIFKTPFSSQNPSSMFTSFINTDGDQYFHDFQQMKLKLKSFRQQIKNTINELNDIKLQIDSYHNEIEKRKQARIILLRQSGLKIGETEDIVDEEEFQLMKQLRETKNHYKEQYDNLQELKMNSNQTQEYVEKCREILSIKFNEWCRNGLLSTSDSMVLNDGYHDNNIILSPQKSQALRTTNVIPSSYDENPLNHTVDQLDDQEAFDRLEESRVIANDPDSLAFFNANKTRRALQTQNLTAIRNMQRTKRLPL